MQSNWDKGVCTKFKKRHRKDLTVEEIESIVLKAKEPFCMLKDVAQQFRLTPFLVGKLVKESETKPEKLKELRDQVELKRRRRDAIENSVAKMLVAK